MKFAIINPFDNSVHDIQDGLAASDIHLTTGAPYLVHADDDTAVGDIYDPTTASFSPPVEVDPPAKSVSTAKAKAGTTASSSSSSK